MTNKVIDESVALQWCQHQRPLMMRVLASFYQQYVQYLQPVSLTPPQTQQLAHDLKSLAPSCGATALTLIAKQLAPPASEPDTKAQQRLLQALAEVVRYIEQHYPEALALTHSGQKDRIEELRQALEQHNLKALGLFEKWATKHALHLPDEVVSHIQDALNSFDFKRARALLDAALLDTKTNDHSSI